MKVVILESLGISKNKLAELKRPFMEKGIEFIEFERNDDIAILKEEIKDADALILANMPLKAEAFEDASKLKFIDIAFTGVDHVDIDKAKQMNIKVSNASGYSTEAVAEWVIMASLAVARKLRDSEDALRALKSKGNLVGSELKNKNIGIIGLGKIGLRVAELFNAFGANIYAYSRHRHEAPAYIRQVSLEEVLKNADYLSLHCPLNEDSKGLINRKNINLMKEGAILLNAARGAIVIDDDLKEALDSGKLAYAALDVYDREPPLNADHKVLNIKNTLLTPHIGFYTEEALDQRSEIVFANLAAWLQGEQINSII